MCNNCCHCCCKCNVSGIILDPNCESYRTYSKCNCCCKCDKPKTPWHSDFYFNASSFDTTRKYNGKCQEDPCCIKPVIERALNEGSDGGKVYGGFTIERNMNCTYNGKQRWHIYIDAIYRKQIKLIEKRTCLTHENDQIVDGKVQVTFDDNC